MYTCVIHSHRNVSVFPHRSNMQLMYTPTKQTRDKNLLDLVLTTNKDLVNNVMVGEPFSDHNAITFTINSAPYTSRISMKYT